MPLIAVHVARIDYGPCSGYVYSFEEPTETQATVNGIPIRVRIVTKITVSTPEGYVIETVKNASPHGDQGEAKMVFDPHETERGTSGRVYMGAARLVELMRNSDLFLHVPNS
jgi:hypothetical protein